MTDLLLLTAFFCVTAWLQNRQTQKIMRYNELNSTVNVKPKKTWFICAMLVMMLLVALRRSDIGNDTKAYIDIFNGIVNGNDTSQSRYEIGYILLNKAVGKITTNPQVLLAVISVFQYGIYTWFVIKHSKDISFSLLLVFLLVYGSTMNTIRQMTAIAFLAIAVDRMLNKYTIRALIWILIAATFHSSAIVFIIVPVLPYIKFNKILTAIAICIVLVLTFTNLLYTVCFKILPQYAHYFSGEYAGSGKLGTALNLLRNFAFFVVIWFAGSKFGFEFSKSRLTNDKQKNLVFWVMFLSFAGLILGFKINLAGRLITYFAFFTIVFLPTALSGTDKKIANYLKIAIILALIAYAIIIQKYRPEWNVIYPYKFFWQ